MLFVNKRKSHKENTYCVLNTLCFKKSQQTSLVEDRLDSSGFYQPDDKNHWYLWLLLWNTLFEKKKKERKNISYVDVRDCVL